MTYEIRKLPLRDPVMLQFKLIMKVITFSNSAQPIYMSLGASRFPRYFLKQFIIAGALQYHLMVVKLLHRASAEVI